MTATQTASNIRKMPTGTKEWADSNVNFLFGCRNDCRYCYARCMAVRFHRKTHANWKEMEVNESALKKRYARRSGRVMFPSTHDLFPEHLPAIKSILSRLMHAGNEVLVTTKPRFEVIHSICNQFRDAKARIQFRFTIGSMHDEMLAFWEPGAPTFSERLQVLQLAYHAGYRTSVSIEPFLDRDPCPLIAALQPFVTESIWLGLMNYIPRKGIAAGDTKWYANIRQNYEHKHVLSLYESLQGMEKIRFKDSIKKMLGLNSTIPICP